MTSKNLFFILASLILIFPSMVKAQTVIPQPQKMTVNQGFFEIQRSTNIRISSDENEVLKTAEFLQKLLNSATWFKSEIINSGSNDSNIVLEVDANISSENPEAYTISINERGVYLKGKTAHGLFNAVQTFRQLLPVEIEHSDPSLVPKSQTWPVPFVEIEDEPRFGYRGMHLDVARHFFSVDFVKKYIDLLAMHKMNRFHWHLTEDQGWRIEIKKYPKLTEVGAYRDSTLSGRFGTGLYDSTPYGGYYTQEEVKEVVKYASDRFITVIPEIEMPGHATAALAAYPEYGCVDKVYKVQTTWGVFEDIFCPKEETFAFLEDVLTKVIELFPSTYIHIGGDEVPKKQWKESALAQEVMKREGLKDENELQSYFITRIEKFLNSKGRQIIGWDEILEGGLAPGATVMSWRGEKGGIEAAKMGHDVIMTPWNTNYFDHFQANPDTEPLAIGGFTTLKDVYHYEPIPKELVGKERDFVLGAQANVWTEYMKSPNKVEYMAYPRVTALSEVLWTQPENKDWLNYWGRLQTHFKRLDILEVNYAKHYLGEIPE